MKFNSYPKNIIRKKNKKIKRVERENYHDETP